MCDYFWDTYESFMHPILFLKYGCDIILCDTYLAWEIDKDMVKVSIDYMQCSLLIIHCKSLPSGKNINNDT